MLQPTLEVQTDGLHLSSDQLEKLGWRPGQQIELSQTGDCLTLRPRGSGDKSIIRGAFRRCHHHANSDDVERCWLRLMMLLWDEDEYKPLRAFRGEAQLPTYLFPIVYHEVIRFLSEAGRNVPLENLPPAMIEQAPQQYESVLRGERLRKLDEVVAKSLTEHERKLLALMREGKKTAEIAQELGIAEGTASVEKSLLLKKLQGLMED